MIFQSPNNPNSYLTVKERTKMSLPTKVLLERNKLYGRILDFGCGLGKDVELLKKMGFDIVGYDPYYFDNYPKGKFDIIICNYVLNVLLPDEQAHVLMSVSELLKPNGKAFYSVRRDIKRNGFIYNPKKKVKTYQSNVILPFKSVFSTKNCEVYEYMHFTTLFNGMSNINPFLKGKIKKLISESATVFSVLMIDSTFKSRILVIPKQKVEDFFKLSDHVKFACLIVANRVFEMYKKRFKNFDLNICIKNNSDLLKDAKQAHIEIIKI